MQAEWNLEANLKTFLFKSLNCCIVDKALCTQESGYTAFNNICLLDGKASSNSI